MAYYTISYTNETPFLSYTVNKSWPGFNQLWYWKDTRYLWRTKAHTARNIHRHA